MSTTRAEAEKIVLDCAKYSLAMHTEWNDKWSDDQIRAAIAVLETTEPEERAGQERDR
jgi:hypothetical protein